MERKRKSQHPARTRACGGLLGLLAVAGWGCTSVQQGGSQRTALMEATGTKSRPADLRAMSNVLAIVGGAAESGSAIAMGRANRMDLAVGIAVGSCIQIALFVAPVLVLLSYAVSPQPLLLLFPRVLVVTTFIAVLVAAVVIGDGRSNWFKGVQLVVVYALIALLAYFVVV